MNITPPKGRPMLYWVGKKPIESVKSYPTQLVEVYDPFNDTKFYGIPRYEDLEKGWHNLLFEGDNKEVLATLLELGFRGKIDLIYIDPPFASNKDYVRKVELRGFKGSRIEYDEAPLLQQVMYEDIWKRDEYFQWIYERLLLMKELLSETGSIFVHLNDEKMHYVKLILDEVFGEDNYRNTIQLRNINKNLQGQFETFSKMNRYGDFLLWYTKNPNAKFKPPKKEFFRKGYWHTFWQPADRPTLRYEILGVNIARGQWMWEKERAYKAVKNYKEYLEKYSSKMSFEEYATKYSDKDFIRLSPTGVVQYYIRPSKETICDTLWDDIIAYEYGTEFSTQKSEDLLYRIISFTTNEGDLVLDCFIGSGTTAAVAQKLGRRWIGVDINKGAVQLTAKRVSKIIEKQLKEDGELFEKHNKKYFTFAIYKVNDYDLKLFQSEAKELAIRHLGIERTKTDPFFEGRLGNKLVKIIDFNHPLTLLDLEAIKDELSKRPEEERDIVIVCYGKELSTYPWVDEWNRRTPINKIQVIDLRTDSEHGGFVIYDPPSVRIDIQKLDDNTVKLKIKEFISPSVIKRFNLQDSLLQKVISDFRSMIDFILIDPDYDGKIFKAVYSDIPPRKQDMVKGEYIVKVPHPDATIAVKVVDVLGGEVLWTGKAQAT